MDPLDSGEPQPDLSLSLPDQGEPPPPDQGEPPPPDQGEPPPPDQGEPPPPDQGEPPPPDQGEPQPDQGEPPPDQGPPALPDLVVKSFSAQGIGNTAVLEATICNQGGSTTKSFMAYFHFDEATKPSCGDIANYQVTFNGGLAAGDCYTQTYIRHKNAPAELPLPDAPTAWVVVDGKCVVTESNESNNAVSGSYTLSTGSSCTCADPGAKVIAAPCPDPNAETCAHWIDTCWSLGLPKSECAGPWPDGSYKRNFDCTLVLDCP